jgi:hypothetical protein
MKGHLVNGQPEGAKFRTEYSNAGTTFFSPNGWSFQVTLDPGVVEIKMSPMTVSAFKKFKDDIQDAIFVSAANEGLIPWQYLGGGHINIGVSVFGDDLLLARNFIVDFWNHNELAMGVLGYDTNNAPPLLLQTESTQRAVRNLIDAFDRFGFDSTAPPVARFFAQFKDTFIGLPRVMALWNREDSSSKYMDVNFNRSYVDVRMSRLEIRCVRPQANIEVWINQIELFEARIAYLRKFHVPIPIRPRVPMVEPLKMMMGDNGHVLSPPVDPQLALKSFYKYVSESGLNWSDHRGYIWPRWIVEGELDKFEQSQFFQYNERVAHVRRRQMALSRYTSCSELLVAR